MGIVVLGLLLLYLFAAYLIIPIGWKRYARHHPSFDDNPRVTKTRDGHPGDPLNVSFIGTEIQLQSIMQAAKWDAAAALGLRSDLKIAADTVLSRSDDEAPVSNLYLFGRKEDLAFEQPVGDSPRKRNHVRFWRTPQANSDGRPIWIGSATYDERVGLSHTTGQITHRIAPDVDAERDHLFADLKQTGELSEVYDVDHFHTVLEGRNGGGDVWRTDGRLMVGVIKPGDAPGNANRLHLVAKTKKTPDPRITIMIDAFDIFAFVVFGVLGCVVLFIVVTLGALPGKIATKRGHPHAAAITAAGFLPF